MTRRASFPIGAAIIAAAFGYWCLQAMAETASKSAASRPDLKVKAHILEVFSDYFEGNGLEKYSDRLREKKSRDDSAHYLVARADDHYADDPGSVILTYDAKDCPVTLPAGRQFMFAYTGPMISEIDAIFPLEPMTWDEMQAMVEATINQFDKAGWQRVPKGPREFSVAKDITPADFLRVKTGTKWTQVGYWRPCNMPWVLAYAEVRQYNSSSPGSFTPPAALGKALPDDAPDRFLMTFRFHIDNNAVGNELRELRDARRIEVNGDPNKEIPISVWLDDPDWRPEGWDGAYIK